MQKKSIVKITVLSLLFTSLLWIVKVILWPELSFDFVSQTFPFSNIIPGTVIFWSTALICFGLFGYIQDRLLLSNKPSRMNQDIHSSSKYHAILQTTPDGFWIVDTHGKIKEVNPALCDLLGYSEQELLAMSIADIEVTETEEDISQHMQSIISSGNARFKTRHRRKDGSILDVEVSAMYIPENNGQFVVLVRDITAQRRIQEDLRTNEELQRRILATSPISIHAIDPRGHVILWNDASIKTMGWTADEVLGKKLPLLPDNKQEEHMDLRQRVLQGESISQFETVRKRKDGSEFPCSLSVSPLYNEDNQVYGVVAFLEDITARKEAECTLQRSEKKFREIFHQANDAIYLHAVDPDGSPGSFLEINDTACEMLGYSQKEFLQMSPKEINATDLNNQNTPVMEQLRTQGNLQFTGTHLTKSGKPVPVEIHADYFTLDGEPRVLSVARDISDRIAAEKAIQESQERLHLAISASNIGLWDWNVQTGDTTFNEQWAQLVGYTLEEISPTDIQTWMDLAHPEDLEKSNTLLQMHFQGETEYYECEARMRHKNGSWIWVRDRGKVIEWTAEGEPLRMTGTHVDITAAKKREAKQEQQISQFQHMVDPIDQGVGILDNSNKITYINEAAAQIFGQTAAEMLGTTITNHLDQSNWVALKQFYREQLAKTDSIHTPIRIRTSQIETLDNMQERIIEIWSFNDENNDLSIIFRIDSAEVSPLAKRLQGEHIQSTNMITLCSQCHNIKKDVDNWVSLETYMLETIDKLISHGLCPLCLQELMTASFEAPHEHYE